MLLSWMSVTVWEQFRCYFLFRNKPTRRSRRTKMERTTDPKTKGLVRKCMSKPFFFQQYAQATCNLSARSDGLYMSSPGNDDDPSSLSRKKVFFIFSFFIVPCSCLSVCWNVNSNVLQCLVSSVFDVFFSRWEEQSVVHGLLVSHYPQRRLRTCKLRFIDSLFNDGGATPMGCPAPSDNLRYVVNS